MSADCIHFWLIETAHGPTAMGQCKLCHAVKEFITDWDARPIAKDRILKQPGTSGFDLWPIARERPWRANKRIAD